MCRSGGRMVWIREASGYRLMMEKNSLSAAEGFVALVLCPQTKVYILIAYCQRIIKAAKRFENIPPG